MSLSNVLHLVLQNRTSQWPRTCTFGHNGRTVIPRDPLVSDAPPLAWDYKYAVALSLYVGAGESNSDVRA